MRLEIIIISKESRRKADKALDEYYELLKAGFNLLKTTERSSYTIITMNK